MISNYTPAPPTIEDPTLQTPTVAPRTMNPGIKPTGAPVTFSPTSQKTMTSMFGNPITSSYDRAMNTGVQRFDEYAANQPNQTTDFYNQ